MTAPCTRFDDELVADLGAADAHLDSCPDCRARRVGYARIADALGAIGAAHARRPDAVTSALARLTAAPRRARWLRYTAPAALALAAAAALTLIWWPRAASPPPRFAVDIVRGDTVALRGDARLGDRIRIRARPGAAAWLYRNDRELLLACPRDCLRSTDALIGERALDTLGRYQIVWLSSDATVPLGDLERDIAAATAAGATHELVELVVE